MNSILILPEIRKVQEIEPYFVQCTGLRKQIVYIDQVNALEEGEF